MTLTDDSEIPSGSTDEACRAELNDARGALRRRTPSSSICISRAKVAGDEVRGGGRQVQGDAREGGGKAGKQKQLLSFHGSPSIDR